MILFDGCSWTFGSELKNREEERWSTLVSDSLHTDHVNLALWGKCNDGILRTTIHHCENHKVDLAVIQFTKDNRREILNGDSYYRVKHGKSDTLKQKASVDYYKYLNTHEDNVANNYFSILIVSNINDLDLQKLERFGKLEVLKVEDIYPY